MQGDKMARLIFDNPLNADEWAFRISQLRTFHSFTPEPVPREIQLRLEIDLSRVRYVDFMVLGRILIFAHAITLAGNKITVRLPNDDLLDDERAFLDEKQSAFARKARETIIARRRRQRLNC